jgi:hypothetical protein
MKLSFFTVNQADVFHIQSLPSFGFR